MTAAKVLASFVLLALLRPAHASGQSDPDTLQRRERILTEKEVRIEREPVRVLFLLEPPSRTKPDSAGHIREAALGGVTLLRSADQAGVLACTKFFSDQLGLQDVANSELLIPAIKDLPLNGDPDWFTCLSKAIAELEGGGDDTARALIFFVGLSGEAWRQPGVKNLLLSLNRDRVQLGLLLSDRRDSSREVTNLGWEHPELVRAAHAADSAKFKAVLEGLTSQALAAQGEVPQPGAASPGAVK